MRFTLAAALIFVYLTISSASVPAVEPYTLPDIGEELSSMSKAIRHARDVEYFLSLPPRYIDRINTHAESVMQHALVHTNDPDTRFMVDCHHTQAAGSCLLLSPFILPHADREENVIMTFIAKRHAVVEPIALVHLQHGDPLRVWDWVNHMAMETKHSLQTLWRRGQFIFPEPDDL